jgi:multidrug efflux pump
VTDRAGSRRGRRSGPAGLCLQARWIVIGVMLLSALAIALVWPTMKSELSPLEDRGTILANINAPDGATLDYTNRYARRWSAWASSSRSSTASSPTSATRRCRRAAWSTAPSTGTTASARRWTWRARWAQVQCLPGVNAFIITPPSLGQGFRDRPLNFVIQTSDSYENLNARHAQMQDEIAKNPGIQGVDVDLRLNKPELRIDIDRDKAADLGVASTWWPSAMETMLGGRR